MNKRTLRNTELIIWILCTALIGVNYFVMYPNMGYMTKIFCVLEASSTILVLMTYTYKVHISCYMLFISELCGYGASLTSSDGNKGITPELLFSFIGIFTITLFLVKAMKKRQLKINVNNIIKFRMEPFKVGFTNNLILVCCLVSTMFILCNSYRMIYTNLTVTTMAYAVIPVFIVMLSIVPVRITFYIRTIYYCMWIILAYKMGGQIIEPLIYIGIMAFSIGIEKLNIGDNNEKSNI